MGMFDTIKVNGGIRYNGKTYKDFQTKDFDSVLETHCFGKHIDVEKIPLSRTFEFYGTAEEDVEKHRKLDTLLRKKYGKDRDKYLNELYKKSPMNLEYFIGVLDAGNVFFMILTQDRKKILKQIATTSIDYEKKLYGWDDGNIYYFDDKKEVCVSDNPALYQVLLGITENWFNSK